MPKHFAIEPERERAFVVSMKDLEWVFRKADKENGPRLVLQAPNGKAAATVFLRSSGLTYVWFVWDQDGIGGENSSEPTVEEAMRQAWEATKRWGQWRRWYAKS